MNLKWIVPLIVLLLATGGCKTSDAEDDPILLTLTSLVPAVRALHLPAFTLTVNGEGFVSDATVECDGRSLPTTFVSTGELAAQVTPADMPDQAGATCAIRVRQGGQASDPLPLSIIADPVFPAPVDIEGTYDRLNERNIVGFKYGLYTPGQGRVMIITDQFADGAFLANLRKSSDYGNSFSASQRLQRNGMYNVFDFAVSPSGNIHILERYYVPDSPQDSAWLSTQAAGQDAWVSRLLTKDPGTGWMNARFFIAPNGDEYILMTWDAAWVRSTDNGLTWSAPRFFPSQDQYTRGDFFFFTPAGRMTLAWTKWRTRNSPPYDVGSSNMSSSTDNGVTWENSRRLPEIAGIAYEEPNTFMLQDANGDFYLFCRRGSLETKMRVATSADDGRTWRYLALPVLGVPKNAVFWDLQADDLFNLNALFLEKSGGRNKMYFLRSCDRGVTWSEPAVVSVPEQYAVLGGRMAVDESGVIHLLLRASLKPIESSAPDAQHLFYCNSR